MRNSKRKGCEIKIVLVITSAASPELIHVNPPGKRNENVIKEEIIPAAGGGVRLVSQPGECAGLKRRR